MPPPARVWTPVRDPKGETYYWNEQTGETTWKLPQFGGPRKKAARTAPKKMDLEKSGTEKRRAAATEGRKSARQKVIDKRRAMEM